jgi:Ni/Co efflux regulator RcnB
MKRIIFTALTAAMLAAPAAVPAFAEAPRHQYSDNRNDGDRNADSFDASRNNGYYVGRAWHFGPPPTNAYHKRGFRVGYKPWRKGDHLGYYRTRYVEVDYRDRHLKAPPRGYHYVRDDKGDILLAAVATGLIAGIIAGSN